MSSTLHTAFEELFLPAQSPHDNAVRPPWISSEGAIPRRIVQPLQEFLQTERSGGILLLAATIVALAWANSPWGWSYERFWHQVLSVRIGVAGLSISEDLRHWVNDGLMALFFLVVGLELKREFVTGDLRKPRAVAFPAIAAIGGMLVPAGIYLALNRSGPPTLGWGIPMATDIAFALGVLTLATGESRSPMKSMLLTLAIVDDLGAIIVIALFYSRGVGVMALGTAIGLLALIALLHRMQIRWTPVYVILGIAVWLATYRSGVHAAIAGVALGLLTPAHPFQRPKAVSAEAHRIADETVDDPDPPDADAEMWLELASLSRETVSPLARMEHLLHPWTSFAILPIFALANAGIRLSAHLLSEAATSAIAIGVAIGLVVGKPLGIVGSTWLSRRFALEPPAGLTSRDVVGLGAVAGIGFTVALFIASLAFEAPALANEARIGILVGSFVSALAGWTIMRFRTSRRR